MPITIRVKDRMSTDVKSVTSNTSIMDAAKIMKNENIGAVLIMDESEVKGILTERDILNAFVDNGNQEKLVSQYMSSPVIRISENANIGRATQLMISKNIRRLVVENQDNKVVGFFNFRDLMRTVHSSFLALFDI